MGKILGYVRISTKDQNEDRQMIAMKEAGVPLKNVYVDKQSGKDFERPAYKQMIRSLKAGDILYIKSIDRLGRNYVRIMDEWRLITKEKQADIVVIDMPLLDTRMGKDLLGTFIADLVLSLFSYMSETERINIRQRQAEGIAAAKARGVHFGRMPKPLPENFSEVYHQWKMKKITLNKAAELCEMPASTFFYKAGKFGESVMQV